MIDEKEAFRQAKLSGEKYIDRIKRKILENQEEDEEIAKKRLKDKRLKKKRQRKEYQEETGVQLGSNSEEEE